MLINALTSVYLKARDLVARDERGATAVEYGLIVGLIAVVIIGAVAVLGTNLGGWFTQINDDICSETTATCAPVTTP